MILLGINTSGIIHFGNYLSLIKPVLNLKKKKIFLADLHSISKIKSTKNIFRNKIFSVSVFLSFFKSIFFCQSYNKNILNLFWLIICFYNKNKTKFFHLSLKKKFISFGQICYPLLMCSDIISNNNKFIFIGYDQIQHIEIYKKIIKKINFFLNKKIFKNCFFIVNNKILYSFDKKKMSKSLNNDLFLFSNIKEIYLFLKKFKNTLKIKKSILIFSLNLLNNFFLVNFFFKNNIDKFINKISTIIYYKFLIFKNNFLYNIKNFGKIFNNINIYNKNNNIIINNNKKIIFNYINL